VARRLAAILAADVVGYSRMMAADEAGTFARLTALRKDFVEPKITEHRGRVAKLMGDGALVEFASVIDAVECAAAIQTGVAERQGSLPADQRIALRIGINIGDVIIVGDDIYGDGVNVAARLEGLAEPGGVCVARNVYDQVKDKVGFGFEPLGEHHVKNIPAPVTVYRLVSDSGSIVRPSRLGHVRRSTWQWGVAAGAAAVVLIVAAGTGWWYREQAAEGRVGVAAALPLPDKPSIAVLPFDNLSGDPEQEYFADGITEDLITDLSKTSGLFVIARNSSFRYKDSPVDPQQVASDLGVRYLLEGSVRRVGDQVRINAQLIDMTTGGHVWAERYDGSLSDVFALQDRVTQRIVDALAVSLTAREQQAQERAETAVPEAYDAFLKGWEHAQKRTPEQYAKALEYFQQAVELDPDYARAHAAIASVYWKSWWEGWYATLGMSTSGARDAAAESLRRAMAEPSPLAHQVAAQILLGKGQHDDAIVEARKAVDLNPNDAVSRAVLAETLIYSGRPEEALTAIAVARRLDPYDEARYAYLEGFARFGMEQFDAAAQLLERALELGSDLWPPEPTTYREADCDPCEFLLAAYGYLGGRDRDIQATRNRLTGTWNAEMMVVRTIVGYRPFKEKSDAERFAEGLRRAGLREY
jgi:adenylate cyclase